MVAMKPQMTLGTQASRPHYHCFSNHEALEGHEEKSD